MRSTAWLWGALFAAAWTADGCRWVEYEEAPSDTGGDTDAGTDTEVDTYPESDCVRYVDADAASGGDGLAWDTAFNRVQDGVDLASDAAGALEESCQVWVAQGTYYVYESSREDTIALATGVALLGGFTGTEAAVGERSWRDNPTILSGHEGPAGEQHVYHVVFSDGDGTIDGFIVRDGRADSDSPDGADIGGGIFAATGHAVIAHCMITLNESTYGGGGIGVGYGWGGSDTIDERSPTVDGCTFVENAGWAISTSAASPTISRCLFAGNPDGAIYLYDSEATITGSTFVSNGGQEGSAIKAEGAGALPESCRVINIVAWYGDDDEPLFDQGEDFLAVSYSDVYGGYDGVGNVDADPLFLDLWLGDFRLQAGSPCIDAADGDTAPEHDLDGNPRVDDPDVANTGIGPPWADMGAYEHQP